MKRLFHRKAEMLGSRQRRREREERLPGHRDAVDPIMRDHGMRAGETGVDIRLVQTRAVLQDRIEGLCLYQQAQDPAAGDATMANDWLAAEDVEAAGYELQSRVLARGREN